MSESTQRSAGPCSGVWKDAKLEEKIKKCRLKLKILKTYLETKTGTKLTNVKTMAGYRQERVKFLTLNPTAILDKDFDILKRAGFEEQSSQLSQSIGQGVQNSHVGSLEEDLMFNSPSTVGESFVGLEAACDSAETPHEADLVDPVNESELTSEPHSLLGDDVAETGSESEEEDETVPPLRLNQFMRDLKALQLTYGITDTCCLAIGRLCRRIITNPQLYPKKDIPIDRITLHRRLTSRHHLDQVLWICSACNQTVKGLQKEGLERLLCSNCSLSPKFTDPYVVTLNLRSMLKEVLPELFPCISSRDVGYPGVQKLIKENNVTSDDILVVANTDGVSVSKSSKASIWPLLAYIYGLPERYKNSFKNMLLLALWSGYSDISADYMQLMLKCFVEMLQDVEKRPIKWTGTDGITRSTRVFMLYLCGDTPGIAKVTCMQTFSANFGCRFCLHEGQDYMTLEAFPKRTTGNYLQFAREAKLCGVPVKGVKAATMLTKLPYFEFPESVPVDVFHAYYGGVVKALIEALLTCKAAMKMSPKDTLNGLEAYLATVTPPKSFSRSTRKLADRSKMKFHEWGILATYYLPVVLPEFFNEVYCRAVYKLISGFHVLCQRSASKAEIDAIRSDFREFVSILKCSLVEIGTRRINIHYLPDHIPDLYEKFGPLYLTSLRAFETANHNLVKAASQNQYFGNTIAGKFADTFSVRDELYSIAASEPDHTMHIADSNQRLELFGPFKKHVSDSLVKYKKLVVRIDERQCAVIHASMFIKSRQIMASAFRIGLTGYIAKEIVLKSVANEIFIICTAFKLTKCRSDWGYGYHGKFLNSQPAIVKFPIDGIMPCFSTARNSFRFFVDFPNNVDLQYE